VNFLLRGTVSRVMKEEINIKFDGDQHVSPYPKGGVRTAREAPPEEGDDQAECLL
jgi:hypothetical protein